MPIFEAILREVIASRKYSSIAAGVCDDSPCQRINGFSLIDKVLFQENIPNIKVTEMTSKVRETYKEPAAERRMVVVQCRFCQHSFGILDRLSYLTCGGKGMTSVARHTETRPVYLGKGPDGFRFYCLHCQRTSIIPVKEPALTEETLAVEQRNES